MSTTRQRPRALLLIGVVVLLALFGGAQAARLTVGVGDADGKPAKLGKDDLKAMDKLLEKRTLGDEMRVEQYGDRVDVNAAKWDARSSETQGDNTNREMIELGERNWGAEMQISDMAARAQADEVAVAKTRAADAEASADGAAHALVNAERVEEANVRREEETNQMRLKRTIEKSVELGRDAEERFRVRGADAVARFTALMDATEAQLADHNDEAFARLDARLALAEQRMKTKLEDAKRRLLALDAEDERRTALAEQRLDAMASAASVRLERRAVRASMQRELAARDAEVTTAGAALEATTDAAAIGSRARKAARRLNAVNSVV